ncbi:hypothetical protein ACFYO8_28930 [Micromonospora sp. NPDC005257]|uniref:hypothetical protein n=1 Tax=Micromonospora sp. NPDC005257 TaxID=3364230 RepID=UPI00367F5DC7
MTEFPYANGRVFLQGFSDEEAAEVMDVVDRMADLEAQVRLVRTWRSYRTTTFIPGPGSRLAYDDQEAPLGVSVSLPARIGVHAAREHLDVAVMLWEAEWIASPAAWSSLCRPAQLNAAQVIWMLAPPQQDERITRALITAADECAQEKKQAEDVVRYALLPPHRLDDARAHIAELTESRRRLCAELTRRGCTRPNFNATAVVQWAAEHLHPGDVVKQYSHMFMWRVGSGAAHGKVWPVPMLARTPEKYDDYIDARQALEPSHLHMFFTAATAMLQAALTLLEQQTSAGEE